MSVGDFKRQTLMEMEQRAEAQNPNNGGKNGDSLRGKIEFRASSRESLAQMSDWERQKAEYRKRLAAVLNTQRFDLCINFVILLNSVSIGWESQLQVQGKSTDAIAWTEHLFLLIYTFELGARFFAFGVRKSLRTSGWVIFDFILVSTGIISQWMLPIIFAAGEKPDALEPLFVFRVLRLLRLARTVRLIATFKTLWLLVRGLMSSADTIAFTFLLMAMTTYIFAVVGMEMISKNRTVFVHADDGTHVREGAITAILDNEFGDIASLMLLLLSFTTLDSVNRVYAPLIKIEPLLFFYFIPFILIVSVAMMNLVTAVIVENALESSKNDKEMNAVYARRKLEQMMPEIKRMFMELDADGSGEISKEEMVDGLESNPEMRIDLEHFLGALDPVQLFEVLNVDGEGQVSITEFCDHLCERVTSEAPIEMTKVLKIVQQCKSMMQKVMLNVTAIRDEMGGDSDAGNGRAEKGTAIKHYRANS
eukprot:g11799.t1